MSSTVPPEAGTAPRVRASDRERMAVAEILQEAVGRGLLSPVEGSDRTAQAFAAVFRDELPPLTADLPPAEQGPQRRWHAGRGGNILTKVGTVLAGLAVAIVAVWSQWSPRRRIIIGIVVGLAVLLVGLGLWGLIGEDHSDEVTEGVERFRQ